MDHGIWITCNGGLKIARTVPNSRKFNKPSPAQPARSGFEDNASYHTGESGKINPIIIGFRVFGSGQIFKKYVRIRGLRSLALNFERNNVNMLVRLEEKW